VPPFVCLDQVERRRQLYVAADWKADVMCGVNVCYRVPLVFIYRVKFYPLDQQSSSLKNFRWPKEVRCKSFSMQFPCQLQFSMQSQGNGKTRSRIANGWKRLGKKEKEKLNQDKRVPWSEKKCAWSSLMISAWARMRRDSVFFIEGNALETLCSNNDLVDGDVDQLHEVANEAHHQKAN